MLDRLVANLRAAAALFMTEDARAARLLAAEKEAFRDMEAAATEAHFARLRAGRVDTRRDERAASRRAARPQARQRPSGRRRGLSGAGEGGRTAALAPAQRMSEAMRLISAEEVRRALDIPSTAAAIRDALLGEAVAPDRHHHAVPDGAGRDTVLLLMPAWTPGGYLGVKLATVAPGNAAKGLPTVIASYLLHEAATGRPLALMDGTMLTLRRTAAASALAADALARKDASRLVVVGTGALAPHLAEAHAAMRPIRRIDVWGRDPAKARATCGRSGGPGPAGATRVRSGSGGARGGHRHLRDDLARAARARRLAAPRHACRSRRRLHARDARGG